MVNVIPVIDLFAGPGGLGEGFSVFKAGNHNPFRIPLSVEKEANAHATLELRSFFRQFAGQAPDDYYFYLQKKISREDLFARWPVQAKNARDEAKQAELGSSDDSLINVWIKERLIDYSGAEWVLIGGPPCQAYSIIGRSRMRSMKERNFDKDPRHFLYRDYLKIIAQHSPAVFVMENVKGILSSKVGDDSIFERILSDLKDPVAALSEEQIIGDIHQQYHIFSLVHDRGNPEALRPNDFIIKCEHYGIPQSRHRVILLGIRCDIHAKPGVLTPDTNIIDVESVLSDLPALRSALSKREDNVDEWEQAIASLQTSNWYKTLSTIQTFNADHNLKTAIMSAICSLRSDVTIGSEYTACELGSKALSNWFCDDRINGVCNHVSRTHMKEDLHRYMFSSSYAKINGVSPTMSMFPEELWPKHKNIHAAVNGDNFNDRFRVQVAGKPASTITCHIAKDGHYSIHYDPSQCRSLTVRETARLQTFPDNYLFEGCRTAQYRQVGNAVPPFLAMQIAKIVYDVFEQMNAT